MDRCPPSGPTLVTDGRKDLRHGKRGQSRRWKEGRRFCKSPDSRTSLRVRSGERSGLWRVTHRESGPRAGRSRFVCVGERFRPVYTTFWSIRGLYCSMTTPRLRPTGVLCSGRATRRERTRRRESLCFEGRRSRFRSYQDVVKATTGTLGKEVYGS